MHFLPISVLWLAAAPQLTAPPSEPAPVQEPTAQTEAEDVDSLPQDEDAAVGPPPPPPPPDGILPVTELTRLTYAPRERPGVLLEGDRLVVVTGSGLIEGYDAQTGDFAWKLGFPGERFFAPVLAEADPLALLVATPSGKLLVVRGSDGEILLETSLPFDLALAPLPLPSGDVVFGTPSGHIVAHDPEGGETRFRIDVGERPLALASSRDLLVVSGGGHTLTALELADGSTRWSFRGRGPFYPPAAFDHDGEQLFIGDDMGELYALGTEKGNVKFRWSTGAAIRSRILVEGKRIYVTSFGNTLYAYNASGGDEQWRADLPGRPATPAMRVHHRLMVVTYDGVFLEIQPERGTLGKSFRAPGELLGVPSFHIEPAPLVEMLPPDASHEPSEDDPSAMETDEPPGPPEPLWFERSRLAFALRTGEVLLMKHETPKPEGAEDPAGEGGEGADEPVETPPRERRPPTTSSADTGVPPR